METRVNIMGLKTLVCPSPHHFIPPVRAAKSELQKQGRRERKERKVNHYREEGLQSEVLGLLVLSRTISIFNSLSFHSFVSFFTLFGSSLREQGSMYTPSLFPHCLRFVNTLHVKRMLDLALLTDGFSKAFQNC